jgi:hypothetical protein
MRAEAGQFHHRLVPLLNFAQDQGLSPNDPEALGPLATSDSLL